MVVQLRLEARVANSATTGAYLQSTMLPCWWFPGPTFLPFAPFRLSLGLDSTASIINFLLVEQGLDELAAACKFLAKTTLGETSCALSVAFIVVKKSKPSPLLTYPLKDLSADIMENITKASLLRWTRWHCSCS